MVGLGLVRRRSTQHDDKKRLKGVFRATGRWRQNVFFLIRRVGTKKSKTVN